MLISAIFNPHIQWYSSKPFNPVLSEFIELSTRTEEGNDYTVQIEQISHHPPVSSYRLKGPTFELTSPNGMEPSKGFKPGFNHVELTFKHVTLRFETATKGVTEWGAPGFRLDNLFGSSRSLGFHGDFWMTDGSGTKFVGKIIKPLRLKG